MVHRLPMVLALIACASSGSAIAQDGGERSAAIAALFGGMDQSVASYCLKASETDQNAITLRVDDLHASALLPTEDAATLAPPVRIGSFSYKGEGVRITSDDPRFASFLVDPTSLVTRLPNGDRLAMWNLVQANGGGACRLPIAKYVPPVRPFPPVTQVAARAHVAGFRPGVSQRFGGRYVGLMHPDGQEDRTLIVTFREGTEHQTRIEADVPLALQGLQVRPPMHAGLWSLLIIGRQSDGKIIQAVLDAELPAD